MGGSSSRRAAAIILLAASAWAADVRVLTTTGVRLDGFGIAGIEEPRNGDGDLVFRAVRTSIDVAGRTIASGDALPVPLTGTIEEISQGAIAGDTGGVLAAANGPDVSSGLFLVEGASVTALVSRGPTESDRPIRRFTMRSNGDLAYSVGSPHGAFIVRRARATGESTVIAETNPYFKSLRGLTMDDSGAIAWMDRRGTVYHWDATHGVRSYSGARAPSGSARRAVALHPPYGVAFATRDRLMRWNPDTGEISVLLARRVRVDGRRVARFYPDVGFLDDGAVSVRVAATRRICVGATPVGCSDRGKAGAGEAVAPRREAGVFRMSGATATLVVRPGDVLPEVGPIVDVVGHAADDTSVAFVGTLADGRHVLGRSRNGTFETLAVDGRPLRGRMLSLGTTIFDARGPLVAVAADLLAAEGETTGNQLGIALVHGARVLALRAPGRKRLRDLVATDAALVGDRVVVLASAPNAFLAGRRRPKPVLVEGDLTFDAGLMAATATRVVFVARSADGGAGLYELGKGKPRLVVALPGEPTFLAAAGDDVAFSVDLSEDGGLTTTQQLWIVRGRSARPLVRAGDPTAFGAIGLIDGLAIAGDDVVFTASLSGDGARHALLAVGRR